MQYIKGLAAGRAGQEQTDRQLLDYFASRGDEPAFACLVERHGPAVLRVCRRVLRHEQDAEDAFQATFLVLARHPGAIRRRDALASWLYGVAYRTAMKAKRIAARRRNHEARLMDRRTDFQSVPPKSASPTWDDVQTVLDEEMQRLPDSLRSAFVLCVLDGKTVPAAAAELGVKEGTLSWRLARARRRLRERLTRRGIQLSAVLAALSASVKQEAGKDKETIMCSGRVIDPDGNPVRGAKLVFVENWDKTLPNKVWATSETDGKFQFSVSRARAANRQWSMGGEHVMAWHTSASISRRSVSGSSNKQRPL